MTTLSEFSPDEARLLERYFTNLDRPVFALRNLPEVVKGALFSRYSRTEKSLRRVLLDEFINAPEMGFEALAGSLSSPPGEDVVATRRAEEFYERVLVGYGDDSVAELAGAHLAVEQVSMLAAKALEDSRIGISPLEKSTRYVRFDRRDVDGRFAYYRGQELEVAEYVETCERLFSTYAELVGPLTEAVREKYPLEAGETDRAWKAATRAKALDLLRGLLPAATFTNLGLFGNGRAFEYLLTKLAASDLPECNRLAREMYDELSLVIPSFVRRALDERHGAPAASRMRRSAQALHSLAGGLSKPPVEAGDRVTLVEHDREAKRRVAAAALFPHSQLPLEELRSAEIDVAAVLAALGSDRTNRRQKLPRALEQAHYTFEIVSNFGAYRDLHRHRMLTQDRQLLGTTLGFDEPSELAEYGMAEAFRSAIDFATSRHAKLTNDVGEQLAQYAVPMAFRVRWYFQLNLRELCHLCELRSQPQGHTDYRLVAQEMFRLVQEVDPELATLAKFVDLGAGEELERRRAERRLDEKLSALNASS